MRGWLAVGVVGIFLAVAPSAGAATTRAVDDDGHGIPSDCNTADVSSSTISAAVTASSAGDTIVVCPGSYPEQVTVNKSLTIVGPQAGVDARTRSVPVAAEAVVNGSGTTGNHTTPFVVTANGVTIDGFTIQEAGDSNNFGFNVLLGAGTSGETFQNNIVRDGIAGLSLGSDSTIIQHNLFSLNNRPGPLSGSGIYTDQFNSGGSLTTVLIGANRFVGNQNGGVLLASTQPGSQSGITISNNTFEGGGNGLLAFNLSGSGFTRNTVSGTAGSSIVIGGGVGGFAVSENSISDVATRAIRVGDFGGGSANSGVTITCNSIVRAPTAGLEVDAAAGAYTGGLDAGFNWWNSPTGPAIASNPGGTGEKIVDPGSVVDYTPFLTDGTDSDPATPGFQCMPKASISDVTAAEGTGATSAFTFTVTLNNPGAGPVSLDYSTADGTATAPSDYLATSGTLAFASSERSKTITVAVTGDSADEPDETFHVTLSNPAGATIADGDGLGTISDDDGDTTPPVFSVKVLKKKLPKALRRGLGVKMTANEAGHASIVAKVKGRVVGRGKHTFRRAGTARVTVKFTRRAKKHYAHARRLRLTLVPAMTDTSGNKARATKTKVTLKR
jgi:Calx-beta domain/Right handed beta helix region